MMSEDKAPKIETSDPKIVDVPIVDVNVDVETDPKADDDGRLPGDKGYLAAQVTRRIRGQIKEAREEIVRLRDLLQEVSTSDQESRPKLDPRLAARATMALNRKLQLKEQDKKTQLQKKLREMDLLD